MRMLVQGFYSIAKFCVQMRDHQSAHAAVAVSMKIGYALTCAFSYYCVEGLRFLKKNPEWTSLKNLYQSLIT